MAEDQMILEEPQIDDVPEQQEGPGPKSTLSDANRKKLDSIVVQMVANKESDENIGKVVDDFKKKYSDSINIPSLDYRKPVQQTIPKESANATSANIPKKVPTETTVDQLSKKHAEAQNILHSELTGNNDIIPGIIKKQREFARTLPTMQEATAMRTDQPQTGAQQQAATLQAKHPDEPVTDQDINEFLQGAQTDPTLGRAFLQHVAENKPDKAKIIQAATYTNDAIERLKNEPNGDQKQGKVFQNAQKIEKGDLHYSVQSGMLTKPEDAWESIATGLQQKNKAFADYDLFSNASPEQAIQELEKRRKEHDADEPIPVPKDFVGELAGGIAGQPLKGLVAGKIAGAGTSLIPGGAAYAPTVDKFISAAVSSNDFRKMSYAHALQNTYNQLRNEGMTAEEAYKKANGQAKDEAMVDALAGGAMMYGAGAIGELKLPSFSLSEGFTNAVKTGLKQGAKGIGEAGAVGLIQGAGEDVKNKLAEAKGIERKGDIGEAVKNGTLFTLGMAAIAKGGSLLSNKTKSQILQGLSKATPEQIDAELGNQILEKHITPEEAVATKKAIEEHRALDAGIPENVTEEARAKIQDKIKRRQYLELQLESADKAFHPEIKEKIKAVNEDILELAKDKIPRGETSDLQIQDKSTGEKAPRGTISNINNILENEHQVGLLEMQQAGSPEERTKILSGLPQRIYERMAEDPSIESDSKTKGQLQKLRKRIQEKGFPSTEELRNMSESEFSDASRKLFESLRSELALPGMSYEPSPGGHKVGESIQSDHFEGDKKIIHVSEDGTHVVVEDPGGAHIKHEIPINDIKPKDNASTIRGDQGQVPEGGSPIEGGQNESSQNLQPPSLNSPVNGETVQSTGEGKVEEPPMTGITHQQTDETAKQLGLDTYEQKPETVAEWDAEADKRLKEDPQTIPKLLKKLEEGHEPDKIDQRIMVRHLSSLKARIEENPTEELIGQYKRAKDLSDIMGGREVAKSLVARRGSVPIEDSLADYLVDEMESSGVDQLTPEQITQNKQEFENISKTEQAYQDKIKDLEAENAKLKADAELAKTKKGTKKGTKKTHEDYVKDRQSIIEKMRADLLKAAKGEGGLTASVPGAAQLAAIAPHVAKLVKSLVEEGVDKLEDIVKNIHGELKDIIEGITEKDVHDIIAGEHSEKKATKNELTAKLRDLKDEAVLINKLESLQNGEEPASPKKKVERNRQITELRKQIKDLQNERNRADKEGNKFYTEGPDADRSALNAIKNRNKTETEKVKEAIAKGEYEPEKKKTPLLEDPEIKKKYPNLVKDVLKSRDEYVKAKQDREIRLLKQQYANRSKLQKAIDVVAEVGNTPRALMSSMDFSAPLRQGLFGVTKQLVSRPGDLARQFGFMFKAAKSQKIFDRWFTDLKDAPDYPILEKSGLPLSDPLDPKLTAKEEAFMSNYAEKIPIIGRFIKGSERAYVGFLNKMRVDMFRRGVDGFAANGKTFENSPELYKAFADYIGAATGRGKMPEVLEKSAPILNAAFFSPRLIASRVNLLTNWANPKFYMKIPKEVRVQYFKDMAKFIGTGMLVLGIAKMGGAEVEDDPRSSDFGKIKSGNTRWDIWGGFQQYVREAAQIIMGQTKSSTSGNINEIDGVARHKSRLTLLMQLARGKLAPVPAELTDYLDNKDILGRPFSLGAEAMKNLPLVAQDIAQAYQDKGVQGALQVGIPSMFGVGVQTYGDGPMTGGSGGGAGAGGSFKIKEWK